MTYGEMMDEVVNQPTPYKDEIEVGETLSFNVDGRMMPVQVTKIGWDRLVVVSLDLKYKWSDLPKHTWIAQRNIMKGLGFK